MRLTVIGKSPAWQDEGGACSGYLVTEGDHQILLDCGNGVFGKLREQTDHAMVDAVFVSHVHADHFFDLVPYAFALSWSLRGSDRPGIVAEAPERQVDNLLFGPPGSTGAFRSACDIWGMPELIEGSFSFREFDPSETIEVGPFRVTFRAVPHYINTWAIAVESSAGGKLVFGADCAPNEALPDFAAGAGLLLAEATLVEPEPDPDDRGHLTPMEAGEIGAAAGVPRLVLTHISDEIDPEWAVAEARKVFDGEVVVAREGMEFDV